MRIKMAELFCGAGGIGLGAALSHVEDLSYEHIWATDYDKDACETYQYNLHPQKIICQDIRKLDFEKLKQYGCIDCLTFGFPCNDFSVVGEKKGVDGVFGALYKYCAKALHVFKPKFFVAENVGGLKNANEGKAFNKVLSSFEEEGYKLFPNLYQFDKYGVPQKRQRIIIVGIRKDLPYLFKIPSYKEYESIDISVRTALENVENVLYNNERTKQSPIVIERLKYIKEGENAFNSNLPPELQLNIKGAKISQIYRRLKADEPSYTITASGGGGTHVYHYAENRALTNRERARIQSFPDDFVFKGSKESVRKQIGMAVPPQGVKVIFEALLKTIAGIDYDSIPGKV